MTALFNQQKKNSSSSMNLVVLNTISLFLIGCLIIVYVMAYKNPPNGKTSNGIFGLWFVIGSILYLVPLVLALLKKVEKVKLIWFWIGACLFLVSLYIGLYKHITF